MFSANENIILRQHKRRVIEYIEATIPENALELGTSVMVMQVSCRQPGCVPLETAVTVVFPKPPKKKTKRNQQEIGKDTKEVIPSFPKALIPGLEESRIGGAFKTRILKPLADVTQDDVLDALPPNFTGGRRTTESLCLKARDMTFAQIGQLVGNDDTADSVEGRKLVAEYLKSCLDEYLARGCVPPEWGEQYQPLEKENEKKDDPVENAGAKENTAEGVNVGNLTMNEKWGQGGNIVFRRPDDSEHMAEVTPSPEPGSEIIRSPAKRSESSVSSQQLLQQISKSEHAPGVRRAGCPCCDPESAYCDKMLGL